MERFTPAPDHLTAMRPSERGDYIRYEDHIATLEKIDAENAGQWVRIEHHKAAILAHTNYIAALEAVKATVKADTYTQEEFEESYEIGKRDGYSDAVQEIDQKTGGDGEYRYCLGMEDSVRHTPDPATVIQRIADRFEVLNLLDEATKTGSDQPDDVSAIVPSPALEANRQVALDAGVAAFRRSRKTDVSLMSETLAIHQAISAYISALTPSQDEVK